MVDDAVSQAVSHLRGEIATRRSDPERDPLIGLMPDEMEALLDRLDVTSAQIKALDLKPGSVLVVKAEGEATRQAAESISRMILDAGIEDVIVIAMAPDADLTMLDEAAMLEYGWMRVPDPMEQLKAIRVAAIAAMEADKEAAREHR